MDNKFIVLEGLDGSGKTSIIKQISLTLRKKYNVNDIVFTNEPGGTPLGNILCALIKNECHYDIISDHSELLMIYAARVQLVNKIIKPALLRGAWVLGDRHDLSSQAYQGGGRKIDKNILRSLHDTFLNNFYPDLTFYLDIPPTIGLERIKNSCNLDRIESASLDFFHRVRMTYQELASLDSTIITINANQSFKKVNFLIQKHLKQWLNIKK